MMRQAQQETIIRLDDFRQATMEVTGAVDQAGEDALYEVGRCLWSFLETLQAVENVGRFVGKKLLAEECVLKMSDLMNACVAKAMQGGGIPK